MSLAVRPFEAGDAAAWDALVARSINGTFLHSRRYLSYHGDRLADASLVVTEPREGRVVGVLPAATVPDEPRVVMSHPGITYGGLVHDGTVRGERLLGVLEDALAEYRGRGYAAFSYKPVPYIFHRWPAGDDLYAMYRLGADRVCQLSAAIDLQAPSKETKTRRQSRHQAARQGVRVVREASDQYLTPFWDILEARLMKRHGARPVHTLEEMRGLFDAFPDDIEFDAVLVDDELLGGIVVYKSPCVVRPQYAAATDHGYELAAVNVGLTASIDDARARGVRYYDLGTSNEQGGRVLNQGLYQFKTLFGAGGVPFETYEIALT